MTGVGVSVLYSVGVSVGVSESVPVGVSDGPVVVTHHDNYKQENNCVRGPAGADAGVDERLVASGGEIRGRHYLITNQDSPTCFPAGEHQLQNGYSATPADTESDSEDSFNWGFTLVLE